MSRDHLRDPFDCGTDALNIFLQRFAKQNDEKRLGKTYVLTKSNTNLIIGFYTLSVGSVSFEILPEKERRLPRYPIPVAHIGRMAIDKNYQGQSLGGMMLIDAFRHILSVSEQIGVRAVEVIAKDQKAKNFYVKYGFVPLKDNELHLYLPLPVVEQIVEAL